MCLYTPPHLPTPKFFSSSFGSSTPQTRFGKKQLLMVLVARVIFAFLFLEIYMALKVGISSEKQAAVSVIYCE